ncbi:MAG: AAA family ATPase [Candidatus Lokiarchaeota archaeon]|nr:AAA family ATPase [Candidatus Lokiarchaeota archaeon]
MRIRLTDFRIRNFRCIDDSGWIRVGDITALVGVNEAGKTALLNGLHTLNPGSGEIEFEKMKDFPRDRVTEEYNENCTIAKGRFIVPPDYLKEKKLIEKFNLNPDTNLILLLERRYNKILYYGFEPKLENKDFIQDLLEILTNSRKLINRKQTGKDKSDEGNVFTKEIQKSILTNIDALRKQIEDLNEVKTNLTGPNEREDLAELFDSHVRDMAQFANTASEEINPLLDILEDIADKMRQKSLSHQLYEEIKDDIPIFIYFEDYYILNGSVVIPDLIKAINGDLRYREFRIQNTLFKHVGLDPKEIYDLGVHGIFDGITKEKQADLKTRKILLDSASKKMTDTLNKYFQERSYQVEYNVDGQFLEVLIADEDRRIKINLEERSKGFRWYFSFFLTFLVESQDAHKNAVLLLDEPGIHLHLQAQFNLIEFFKKLKDSNQVIYTTHSPFLIDEENLSEVRSVYENGEGKTKVTEDNLIPKQKSVFPLQATLSYKTSQKILKEQKQILVENESDYNYINVINLLMEKLNRETLNREIMIIPCKGSSKIEYFARLFVDLNNFPIVLLHSDENGQKAYDRLIKTLFIDKKDKLMLLGNIFNHKQEYEVEDLFRKETLIKCMNDVELTSPLIPASKIDNNDQTFSNSLVEYCNQNQIKLPIDWRYQLSMNLKNEIKNMNIDDIIKYVSLETINDLEKLIKQINLRIM